MLSTGGAERVISELANELVKQDIEVSLIQLEPRSKGDDYCLTSNVNIVDFNESSCNNKLFKRFAEIKFLQEVLKRNPDSVAISFIFSTNYLLALCKFFVKNKIILSERNDPNAMSKMKQIIQKSAFCLADACVFQTKDAASFYPKSVQKKGVIIRNPINSNLPERHFGERRKVIVTASRLDPQKNLGLLIDSFKKLNERHSDYNLEIYGRSHMNGNTEKMLKQKVIDLHLEDKVAFMGFSTNLHKEIKDCAMYVCSSDYEGISNSLLEAMALGIPTISTDCPIGGARDMIKNKVNGILVPVKNVEAMYEAMKYVIENPNESEKMSTEAYKIRCEYPIEKIAKEWIEVFKTCAKM